MIISNVNTIASQRRGATTTPFDPLVDLAGKLPFWYQQKITNDGATVSIWVDESGNSNHAIQSIGTKQPEYLENVVGTYEGLGSDGVDDFMTVGDPLQAEHRDDFAYMFALRLNDGQPAVPSTICGKRTSPSNNIGFRFNTYGKLIFFLTYNGDGAQVTSNDAFANGQSDWMVLTAFANFTAGTLTLRKNNVEMDNDGVSVGDASGITPSSYTSVLPLYLFARNNAATADLFADVDMVEGGMIATPTESQISRCEQYLMTKYSIS